MEPSLPTIDFRDFWFLSPAIVLSAWGLVVLMVDLVLARRLSADARRERVGWLAMAGVLLALVAQLGLSYVQSRVQADSPPGWMNSSMAAYFQGAGGVVFLGSIAVDPQTTIISILFLVLLGLVAWLSTSWTFTENWGEYYALLMWATVGMMLLAASEELITLFLTLETMTICLYLLTAFEKTRRRSAEGGLKYFVYGSVSSALFLFGLSLLYGLTGTTQFEAIRLALDSAGPSARGLSHNVAGATALLLMLVGFGFKVAAVPFHQWAPDAYEGAPAAVTAWVATGSKLASFIALMKVFLHALQPWSYPSSGVMGPGWLGVIAVVAGVTMTYGNFAALAQTNLKRMLAYSSIAHAGYMLVGVAAASVSTRGAEAAGSVLFYLVIYAFTNIGAFAVAAWLVRDRKTDEIDDLNGLAYQSPVLAVAILVLMLSLIGMPPFAGFFGKLYMFMEALNQQPSSSRLTLISLVALGLMNSVVSAFYYVRVLKAMFLRPTAEGARLRPAGLSIQVPILLGAAVATFFGLYPDAVGDIVPNGLVSMMRTASIPMLTATGGGNVAAVSTPTGTAYKPLKEDRRGFVTGRDQEEIRRRLRESAIKMPGYGEAFKKGQEHDSGVPKQAPPGGAGGPPGGRPPGGPPRGAGGPPPGAAKKAAQPGNAS
ncbi:NADH-quinone oxidoreductase subunit N [Aquisphaera giovannonii]|uniref:NADH-quinone oxidoreductase subunit N n=1 Tax=Aquisphaera giovannonii TaxID=406548 RepID=A0A5B9VZP6_9BACT|nr:NADH-quinone oxidoreductase subunit N [Aquisphaera giovannonii]QEH33424.1 NADH-quinone oxidoreductase subunit N [Aquisphaera giovannonii]